MADHEQTVQEALERVNHRTNRRVEVREGVYRWEDDGETCPRCIGESALAALVAERDRLREALADARPYVYSVLCVARTDGQPWRVDTAERTLARVDAALEPPT